MLRSQSISNLNDHRKSKGSFFGSLRARKASNADLASAVESEVSQSRKPRPLSTSISITNINGPLNKSKPSPISYNSSASQQRQGLSNENKENQSPTIAKHKSLKSRSSAPNLKSSGGLTTSVTDSNLHSKSRQSSKQNRSSIVISNVISKPISTASTIPPNILEDSTKSQSSSPITPETLSTVDSLFDSTSIQFLDFENNTDSSEFDISDSSSIIVESKAREDQGNKKTFGIEAMSNAPPPRNRQNPNRTTRIFDSDEFVKFMYSSNGPLSNKLFMDHQKSVESEKRERKELTNKLNSTSSAAPNLRCNLSLLGNTLLFTTYPTTKSKLSYEEFINEIDSASVLQNEPYNDSDLESEQDIDELSTLCS